ncbi:hypothetical protein EVAR_36973_1 [Eumeta japonica]|uniref:Uncharacterized protein n=1 Tax=Eumeta variegata TaxID=151549 RepID=A0A4C1W712_EUMVA|nr:hypothetical protein EVAR_36973_1 [Eumeta japonica]
MTGRTLSDTDPESTEVKSPQAQYACITDDVGAAAGSSTSILAKHPSYLNAVCVFCIKMHQFTTHRLQKVYRVELRIQHQRASAIKIGLGFQRLLLIPVY